MQSYDVELKPVTVVPADGYGPHTVQNVGPDAVYYKVGTTVSSTSNDGTLASGGTLTVTTTMSFIAQVSSARIVVTTQSSGSAVSAIPTATQTGPYTASVGDDVRVDTTGGAVTITLPAGAAAGAAVGVKKIDFTPNAVTVAANAGDSVDGGTTLAIPNLARVFRKDGSGVWMAEASNIPVTNAGNARYDRQRCLYIPSDTCLTNLREALTRARNGGYPVRYLVRGDSTTYGIVGSGGQGNPAKTAAFTATTTNTSTTLSNVTNFAGISVGSVLAGTGITGGTTVSSLSPSTSSLGMSSTATATANGVAVTAQNAGAASGDPHLISWVDHLRTVLASMGSMGGVVGESITQPDANDARVTVGAGWTVGPPITAASTAGGNFTIADDNQANAWDIMIQESTGSGGATFSVQVDGGVAQTFTLGNALPAPFVQTVRVTAGAVGAHTLTIHPPSAGTIFILAVDPLNTATPPLTRFGRVGVSGQTLATLNPSVTGAGSNMSFLLNQKPDVAHLFMGINDMHGWTAGNGTPAAGAAAYQANLISFAQAFQAIGCDPIFTVWPSYNYAAQSPGTYEQLLWHQAIYTAAEAQNVAVLDLQRRWGYGTAPTTGANAFYDGTHPTVAGYWDVAKMVANVLAAI